MCVTIKFWIQLTHRLLWFQYNICYHWNNRCVLHCETKGKLHKCMFFKRNQVPIKLFVKYRTVKITAKGKLTEGVSSKWGYLPMMLLIKTHLKIRGKQNILRTPAFDKLGRREVIMLKDLENYKGTKQKIAKSGRGVKNEDFPTLLSRLSVLDWTPLLW